MNEKNSNGYDTKILLILYYQEKFIAKLLVIDQLISILHEIKDEISIFQNMQKSSKTKHLMQNYNQIEMVYALKKILQLWCMYLCMKKVYMKCLICSCVCTLKFILISQCKATVCQQIR